MPALFSHLMSSDGASGSIRKLSDDLIKTRINEEAEENDDFSHDFFARRSPDRKSSIGGLSSNDSLWGDISTARRLSEAGLRRTSDNSVVLTEDTDSFIVGDRVWVGGTKPGRIAYIGETKFAPGEWAGIVLDEPIGKNDGAVGNTRYFQCEPKKGVFSKLTRLTRSPIAVPEQSSPSPSSAPTPVPSTPLASPPASIKGSFSARSPTPSSVATPSPAPTAEIKIGERVIVMSQQGSKAGILRFKGTTTFATGEWCGVELDDPLGKNDGTVEGVRYFTCEPKFGLFAPAHKVSRSPTKNRRPSCQVHHNTTSLRRVGSKESLASSITSAASSVRTTNTAAARRSLARPLTSLSSTPKPSAQDLIKCKQDQINQLLKEKQLDRAALTNAAQQADELERKLGILQTDYDKLCATMTELQVRHDIASMETVDLKSQNSTLSSKLGEAQAQLEDFQFRAEEATIFKSDIQVANQKNEEKIKELEQLLLIEQTKNESLCDNLGHIQEATVKIESLRAEVKSVKLAKDEMEKVLKQELIETIERANRMEEAYNQAQDELTKTLSNAESDKSKSTETAIREVDNLKATIDELSKLNNKHKEEITKLEVTKSDLLKAVETKNVQITGLTEEMNQNRTVLSEVEKKRNELTLQLECSLKEVTDLRVEFETALCQLTEAKAALNTLTEELHESQRSSTDRLKQVEELKAQLEINQSSLAQQTQLLSQTAETEKSRLKSDLDEMVDKLKNKDLELGKLLSSNSALEENLSSLKRETDLLNESKAGHVERIEILESALRDKENELLNAQQNAASGEVNSSRAIDDLKAQVDRLTTSIAEGQTALSAAEKERVESLARKNEEIQKLEGKFESLELTNATLNSDKTRLESELNEMKRLLADQTEAVNDLRAQISIKEKDIASKVEEAQTASKLNRELQEGNAALESSLGASKTQLQKLELELGDSQRQLADATNRCQELLTQKGKLEADLTEVMTNSSTSSTQLSKLHAELSEKSKELDALKVSSSEAARLQKNREQELTQLLENVQTVKAELEKDLESSQESNRHLNSLIQDNYKAEISELTARLQESNSSNERSKKEKDLLNEQVVQLEKSLKELSSKFEESERVGRDLMKTNEEAKKEVEHFQTEKSAKAKEFDSLTSQMSSLQSDVHSLSKEKSQLLDQLTVLQTTNDDICRQLAQLNDEKRVLLSQSDSAKTSSANELSNLEKIIEEKESINRNQSTAFEKLKAEIESTKILYQSVCEQNDFNKQNLDELRSSIQKLRSEKEGVEEEKNKIDRENESLKSQHQDLKNALNNFEVKETQWKEEISLMGKRLENLESSLEASSKTIDVLKTALNEKSQLLAEAQTTAQDKEAESAETNRRLQAKLSELKIVLDMSQEEHDSEIEKFKVRLSTLESALKVKSEERDNILSELTAFKEDLKTAGEKSSEMSSSLLADIEKLKSKDNESEKKIESLTTQVANYADQVTSRSNKISDLESLIDQLKSEVETLRKSNDDSTNAKLNFESELERLTEQTKSAVVEKIELVQELERSEERVAKLKQQLSAEVSDRAAGSAELSKLQSRLNGVTEEKEILENKLKLVENELVSLRSRRNSSPTNNNEVTGNESLANNWLEEKEFAESQINFLNSIIVDMKKKNENLEAQVGAYEASGVQLTRPKVKKEIAPRLFCDICDVFDLHDTEDCPQQASSDSPPPQPVHRVRPGTRKFEERPYCDICEMFGHLSHECDDSETF